MLDTELIVSLVYERACCSELRPPGPVALLREMIGAEAIAFVDGKGSITGLPGRPRVRVRRGLHGESLCLAFGRAAAVVAFARHHRGETISEERLSPLTSALIMPEPAIRSLIRLLGPRQDEIARIFMVPLAVARERLRCLGIGLASGRYVRVGTLENAG